MAYSVRPDSTLADVLRLKAPGDFQCALIANCLENAGVIELFGPHGCGKTQLVNFMMALVASPREYGGLGGHVFLLDCDRRFFASGLESAVKTRLSRFILQDASRAPVGVVPATTASVAAAAAASLPTAVAGGAGNVGVGVGSVSGMDSMAHLVRHILSRVMVYRCRSESEQLNATAACLERCRSLPGHKFFVLESMASFYWAGRMGGEAGHERQVAMVRMLRELVTTQPCTVLATKPPLWGDRRSDGPRDYALPGWPAIVRWRLQVVPGAGVGSLSCLRERTDRGVGQQAHFYIDAGGVHFVGST